MYLYCSSNGDVPTYLSYFWLKHPRGLSTLAKAFQETFIESIEIDIKMPLYSMR
jgi:hypothetical protein